MTPYYDHGGYCMKFTIAGGLRMAISLPAYARLVCRGLLWQGPWGNDESLEEYVSRIPGGVEELYRIRFYVFYGPRFVRLMENLRQQCTKCGKDQAYRFAYEIARIPSREEIRVSTIRRAIPRVDGGLAAFR